MCQVAPAPRHKWWSKILIQIGQCVPSAWWPQTKLSVTGERISFKKLLDGEMHNFIMKTDSRGVLWTKKVRRKI